jgi:signal transduction histidine kinase
MTIDGGNLWENAAPTRLEQIAINLLTYAAKYSECVGHIWFSTGHEGRDIVIRLKDAGIGMSPEKLLELFQLFNQVDHTWRRSEGGLATGLALVQQLGRVDIRRQCND